MKKTEPRIYVVVAATVQVGSISPWERKSSQVLRTVIQPLGRQIAQACHVTGKLRQWMGSHQRKLWEPITTIILKARDSSELYHVLQLLVRKKIRTEAFLDTNADYHPNTAAMTVVCTEPVLPKRVVGILDYLPLWGAE